MASPTLVHSLKVTGCGQVCQNAAATTPGPLPGIHIFHTKHHIATTNHHHAVSGDITLTIAWNPL
jgi:hypothetical protein